VEGLEGLALSCVGREGNGLWIEGLWKCVDLKDGATEGFLVDRGIG
jgi:hypothetical protein